MAEREISVFMESRYKSNLSAELRRDKRKIDAFQEHLKRRPLNIPVTLDLKGAMTQAQALRKAILGEFSRIPSSILGADGRPATGPSGGAKSMNSKAGVLSQTEFQKFDKKSGQWITEQVQMVEQLGRGVSQLSKFKGASSEPFATVTKDISNIQDLRDSLRGMNAELGQAYGKARGNGDKQGQVAALSEQRARLNAALNQAAQKGLENSSDYQRAENQINRIGERIASLQGGQESAAVKKARQDRTREIANDITMEERRVQSALKNNKLEMDATERIGDKAQREAQVNRLYDERKKIFEASRDKFRQMDQSLQQEGRPDLADRAMRRGMGMQNQVDQSGLDKQRAETDAMRQNAKEQERIDKEAQQRAEKAKRLADKAAEKTGNRNFSREMRLDDHATKQSLLRNDAQMAAAKAIPDQAAREAELNRVLAERSRIYNDQSNRLQKIGDAQASRGNVDNAAKAESAKLKAQENSGKVAVDQTKADAARQSAAQKQADEKIAADKAKAISDQKASFAREMQDIKSASDMRIAEINRNERRERAAAKSASERAAAAQKGHSLRQTEYGNLSGAYAGLESRARGAGQVGVADNARGKRLGADVSGARDMEKFATASNRSGHALNFHSSALLRNAATFARWMVPAQAVLGTVRAFNAGFAGAMQVDRQFATLRAVFRGTGEEAQKLKKDTLDLAVAQGRGADEAMDAAIRWSRLGLNRVQVNQAVKTSLIAANVAEIKAAEAAEKLSAIYATYRLKVGDLPVVLSRLNAISNRYNVTNKDLLEGIVRVAGVAKTAGMELRDLEGIIGAVTGATGRPGQEVGNALKFVITRLSSPETMEGLKKNFDIDLTGPNGDLKNMSQIFRELADIYPTLNNSQKQYFLKLTAGSRQAARFALVLDQYRQAQILAAEAAFDTNSAFEENQKILESLQSRVDSLKASWVDLFTAWGDAGVFDFLEKRLRYIQQVIQDTAGGIEDAAKKSGEITVTDPSTAETVERLGGGENALFGNRKKFSKAELEVASKELGDALSKEKNRGGVDKFLNQKKNWFTGKTDPSIEVGGIMGNKVFSDEADLRKTKDLIDMILEDGGRSGAADRISMMTNEVDKLRERVSGLQYGVNIFESLGSAIEGGHVDRSTMIRDFENGAHLLLNLEDGSNKYTQSLRQFYDMLDAGDTKGIAKLTEDIRLMFSGALDSSKPSLDSAIEPALKALRNELIEIDKAKRALNGKVIPDSDPAAAKEHMDQLESLQGQYKQVQQSIEQVTQAVENMKNSAYGFKQSAGINSYLDDLGKAAELFKDAFQDFSPDADNDPVERVFQRRRNALNVGRSWLEQTQAATNNESDATRAKAQPEVDRIKREIGQSGNSAERDAQLRKELEIQQRIIDQQNEADLLAKTKLANEIERLAPLQRELEIRQQIANLQRISQDSGKQAANSSLAYRFGSSDSEKDYNQGQFSIDRANKRLAQAGGDWWIGRDTDQSKAAASGQILQDEATARAALEAIDRRQYDLEAARRQVAYDTLEAMRQQTEEASKRLALASREDQLRAAALARTIRDKGPIRDNEFFALSQNSRQIMTNYLPNQAPGSVNDAKINASQSYREINKETAQIAGTIGNLRGTLDELAAAITKASRSGGEIDQLPSIATSTLQTAAGQGQRDQKPVINFGIGDVTVNVAIPDQIKSFMEEVVTRQINTGLSRLRAELNRPAIPSAYPFVE